MTDAPETIFTMPTRWKEGHGPDIDWTKGDWHTLPAKSPLCESYTRTDIAQKVKPLVWENKNPAHGYPDEAIDAFGGKWSRWWVDGEEYFLPPNRGRVDGRSGNADEHHDALILSALVTRGEE